MYPVCDGTQETKVSGLGGMNNYQTSGKVFCYYLRDWKGTDRGRTVNKSELQRRDAAFVLAQLFAQTGNITLSIRYFSWIFSSYLIVN